jgi:hypothetical protein
MAAQTVGRARTANRLEEEREAMIRKPGCGVGFVVTAPALSTAGCVTDDEPQDDQAEGHTQYPRDHVPHFHFSSSSGPQQQRQRHAVCVAFYTSSVRNARRVSAPSISMVLVTAWTVP